MSCNYIPSCFGSSIEALIQMHGPVREVPTSLLLDLVRYLLFSCSLIIYQSIEALIQMHGPVREVPTSLLLDLVRYFLFSCSLIIYQVVLVHL